MSYHHGSFSLSFPAVIIALISSSSTVIHRANHPQNRIQHLQHISLRLRPRLHHLILALALGLSSLPLLRQPTNHIQIPHPATQRAQLRFLPTDTHLGEQNPRIHPILIRQRAANPRGQIPICISRGDAPCRARLAKLKNGGAEVLACFGLDQARIVGEEPERVDCDVEVFFRDERLEEFGFERSATSEGEGADLGGLGGAGGGLLLFCHGAVAVGGVAGLLLALCF